MYNKEVSNPKQMTATLYAELGQETRDKILKRCKISIFLGDASVGHEYLKLDDESLLNSYGWLLENWDESLDLIPCH